MHGDDIVEPMRQRILPRPRENNIMFLPLLLGDNRCISVPAHDDWALGMVDDVVRHRAHDGVAYLAWTMSYAIHCDYH